MEDLKNDKPGYLKLGPFRTRIDDAWITGEFKDMPIELEDRTLLDLGIHNIKDYEVETGSGVPQTHYITWSVEIHAYYEEMSKHTTVGLHTKEPEIISIESSIEFEYYEPHSEEPKTYQWDATLNLKEWSIDASDFEWSSDGQLAISNMEMDFTGKTIVIQR